MSHLLLRSTTTGAGVAVALGHLLWPHLHVDSVTALLLLVAVVPWLEPLFKSVELPGGVKVEFQQLETVAKHADAAGLLAEEPALTPGDESAYSFQLVATTDPNLALAGLRIELERRLDHLARSRGYDGHARGIGNLLRHLHSRELINGPEDSVLRELVDLLNSAVHGAEVDPQAAEWALDVRPRILRALDERASTTKPAYTGISE